MGWSNTYFLMSFFGIKNYYNLILGLCTDKRMYTPTYVHVKTDVRMYIVFLNEILSHFLGIFINGKILNSSFRNDVASMMSSIIPVTSYIVF